MVCFPTKNHNLGKFWRALEWKILVYTYYDHLEYFTAMLYNLWPFVINCGHLVYFYHFGMFGPRKIWQPWPQVRLQREVQPNEGFLRQLAELDEKLRTERGQTASS
jgi:hypothetical protein